MKKRSTHYSYSQNPMKLAAWAKKKAAAMAEGRAKREYFVLCYAGMSGVSFATALSLALHAIKVPHGMCYVRKANEVSHGLTKEVNVTLKANNIIVPVFVDDFIDCGGTFSRVMVEVTSESLGCDWCGDTSPYQMVEDKSYDVVTTRKTAYSSSGRSMMRKYARKVY